LASYFSEKNATKISEEYPRGPGWSRQGKSSFLSNVVTPFDLAIQILFSNIKHYINPNPYGWWTKRAFLKTEITLGRITQNIF
jgi:hypothetical protein